MYMYIPNDDTKMIFTSFVDDNQYFKLNKQTNQNLIKVHKVDKPTNKKTLL